MCVEQRLIQKQISVHNNTCTRHAREWRSSSKCFYNFFTTRLIANMNSQMRLWAWCSMSLLLDSERSLKSLLAKTKCSVTLASNYFSQNYLSHLLYKLCCECAVGNPFAIEGQNMNSQTRFWAQCSTSLLLDSERSLKSLLADMKQSVRLAMDYFSHKTNCFVQSV